MSDKNDRNSGFRAEMATLMKDEDNLISYLENTAHQMRTPMTLIKSYTELLLAEVYGYLGPDVRQRIETISTNLDELTYFVDQVQDMGLISNENIILDTGLSDLSEIVEKIAGDVSSIGSSRNVNFGFENLDDVHLIRVDQYITRRAVSHLLRYVVSTAPVGNNIKLVAKVGKERTLLIVFGFGEVMSKEHMERIVKSMSEKEAKLTTMEWERLSLPIAKALMDLQGGGLTIFEDEDDRTVYVMEFLNK